MNKIIILVATVFATLAGIAGIASAGPSAKAAPACSSSLLTWFAPDGNGFAGGASYVVEFSNTGKATCTVKGFPTVKLTENGRQVGFKATTFGPAPAKVTLKRGQTGPRRADHHGRWRDLQAGAGQRLGSPATGQDPGAELPAGGLRRVPG